jgi:hypothetical protein
MKTKKVHVASCQRDGNWWFVEVNGLRGGFTQAKRLDQVEPMAREVISLLLKVPEDSFDVEVTPILPAGASLSVANALRFRANSVAIQEKASLGLNLAATRLAALGLPIRDIGTILGVSHQRISQLLSTPLAKPREVKVAPRSKRALKGSRRHAPTRRRAATRATTARSVVAKRVVRRRPKHNA